MRTELQEPASTLTAGRKLRRLRSCGPAAGAMEAELEPLAVDAAFADDSLPMLADEGPQLRVDGARSTTGDSDDGLLESLSQQLDLLDQQQREIRRLISRAGRRRIDRANW